MSLLIKGMEMPKQGRVTLQIGADGAVYVVDKCEITAEKYEKNFEVFEIPPHGDLIGREWLIDIALHLMNTAKNDDIANGVKWMWQYIIESPTIISADKDGET